MLPICPGQKPLGNSGGTFDRNTGRYVSFGTSLRLVPPSDRKMTTHNAEGRPVALRRLEATRMPHPPQVDSTDLVSVGVVQAGIPFEMQSMFSGSYWPGFSAGGEASSCSGMPSIARYASVAHP